MPSHHLDHAPAALLRYLYDRRNSIDGIQRLLDMGMVSTRELSVLLSELEQKGLVIATREGDVPDAQITDDGIAWVRSLDPDM